MWKASSFPDRLNGETQLEVSGRTCPDYVLFPIPFFCPIQGLAVQYQAKSSEEKDREKAWQVMVDRLKMSREELTTTQSRCHFYQYLLLLIMIWAIIIVTLASIIVIWAIVTAIWAIVLVSGRLL